MEKSVREIQLPKGPIRAAVEDDLIVAQNVKFAGSKRFKPPSEISPWTTPMDCLEPGPLCPQLPFDFEPLGDIARIDRVQDENCLIANVVAPANSTAGSPLPVLVWIHGGAYMNGTGDLAVYDTRPLARLGLVVVSIQYRLGIFGYARINKAAPANLGLMDQIEGLKWVQQNAAAFGGDPKQVTIFGQSAGGDAVYSLLQADGTEGLFQQAVIISVPFGLHHTNAKAAATMTRSIEKKADKRDLRDVSTADLLEIQKAVVTEQAGQATDIPRFVTEYDQAPLPSKAAALARMKANASRIRIMVGWTKDDALPFLSMIPPVARIERIPIIGTGLMALLGRASTYFIFGRGSASLSKQYIKAGGSSSTFCIEWYPKGNKYKACHCMESPLLFGGYEQWRQIPMLVGADHKVYEHLSGEVKKLFLAFARGENVPAKLMRVREHWVFGR